MQFSLPILMTFDLYGIAVLPDLKTLDYPRSGCFSGQPTPTRNMRKNLTGIFNEEIDSGS